MSRSQYKPPNLPKSVTLNLIEEWVRGEKKRSVLADVYFDELTIEQLAEKYDIGVSTVKRWLADAHEQLYQHLRPEPGGKYDDAEYE